MKGQYFSFDAIIATVIMVIAFTALISYWYGVQSVVDSRTSNLHMDALRVAESLMSQGYPSDWENKSKYTDLGGVRQIGLMSQSSPELSKAKLMVLQEYSLNESMSGRASRLMRATASYHIFVEAPDGFSTSAYDIGRPPSGSAKEVAIVHRAATLGGRAVKITVTLWR